METETDNFKNGGEVKRLKECALAFSNQSISHFLTTTPVPTNKYVTLVNIR